ncbi:SsrA-binding protein SmpB [Kiloniella laminariae]|uniref:SsrA-binding protein n=1 Tax=Kiloniella laminariae TaxID=454162 RepID=A0ABT4LGF3_9PROT|nr:SsrA-binding protein SmpB [Kiloniella laminariae]MCZ4280189.1 SsrA-binding protein SmpB [Kiloniella laminariae]
MAKTKKKSDHTGTTVAVNRRARYDYQIEDTLEAGMMLVGTEVKSLRSGKASIQEAYASEENGAFYLINANIPEYGAANRFNHEPKRPRKLLVHKKELTKMIGLCRRDGYTIVPLSLYFNDRGIAKINLGFARGKKSVDKRHTEKERDWKRQQARIIRDRG